MRFDKASIYRKELERALDRGLVGRDAHQKATEEAEDVYWNLVDRGRQEAKDRE